MRIRTRSGCLLSVLALVVLLSMGIMVVVAASLGGMRWPWSDRSDSARFGQARPATGTVPVRLAPGKLVPARKWPTACQLIDDADITAVLPDATEIDEFPGGVSTRTIDEYSANPAWREEPYAPEGRCVWHMKLPGERTNAFTFVWVRIVAVGDPELIRRYHDDQELGRGAGLAAADLPGGGSCYPSSLYDAHLVCARGPLMFEVGGSTTTDFGDFRAYSFWRDEVLTEFAATVAGKIRLA